MIQKTGDYIKTPINLYALIIFRVLTLLLIFLSLITLLLAIVMRPWKSEYYKGAYAEISLWTICRYHKKKYYNKCFYNYYNDITDDIESWFYIWRYFLVVAVISMLMVFSYLIIEQTRKQNHESKPWGISAVVCLFAGTMAAISVVLFIIKFPFDFIEETFRWEIMGWTEETGDKDGFEEIVGMPYIMCWVSVVSTYFASCSCYYMKCKEDVYIKKLSGQYGTSLGSKLNSVYS